MCKDKKQEAEHYDVSQLHDHAPERVPKDKAGHLETQQQDRGDLQAKQPGSNDDSSMNQNMFSDGSKCCSMNARGSSENNSSTPFEEYPDSSPSSSPLASFPDDNSMLQEMVERLRQTRADNTYAHTYVITGASSGIGLYAAKLLAVLNPLNRLILVVRNQEKAHFAREQVLSVLPKEKVPSPPSSTRLWDCKEHVIALVCDHCSLDSVRQFNVDLRRVLNETYRTDKWKFNGVDYLCLNAAVLQARDAPPEFTHDGLETTFQTNHLAPFLLVNLIQDLLNPFGRVVITTSGLFMKFRLNFAGMEEDETTQCWSDSTHFHQPLYQNGCDDEKKSASDLQEILHHANHHKTRKGFEMMDGSPYHFKNAYSQSKLCNVALCLELNKRLKRRGIVCNTFSPGLITRSGLFRRQPPQSAPPPASGDAWKPWAHDKSVLLKEKTVAWGAGALVYMCIGDATGQQGGQYWSDTHSTAGHAAVYGREFCPRLPTEEEIPTQDRAKLWNHCCHLAGISTDMIRP